MGVRLHNKYGVNPAVYNCFYCNEEVGLILPGSQTKVFREAGLADGDGKMHSNIGVMNMEPCSKCAEYMKQGVIMISAEDDDVGSENPYRTGGWAVVKDDAIKRIGLTPQSLEDDILRRRFCFLGDDTWDFLGLPREEINARI
jgi:hypothetical protein